MLQVAHDDKAAASQPHTEPRSLACMRVRCPCVLKAQVKAQIEIMLGDTRIPKEGTRFEYNRTGEATWLRPEARHSFRYHCTRHAESPPAPCAAPPHGVA